MTTELPKPPSTDETLDLRGIDRIKVITSKFMPPGTMIIGAADHAAQLWSIWMPKVHVDWGPTLLPRRAAAERTRAFAFLEQLLDDMCLDFGMDPDETWRGPRADEQREQRLRFERYLGFAPIAMPVLQPTTGAVLITGIT